MAEKRASTIKIFISHSSKDKDIVKALIDFIEASIDAPTGTIRCTTVPGYKLEGGDDGADVLRADLANANVVIGVFTASSMLSRFVLMELGAGWGLDKRCIPLIGPGADFKDLVGPYQKLHGVKLDSLEDMADIPKTIANATGLPKLDNAAKAIDALGKLVALVKAAPLSKDGAVAAPPAKAPPSSMDDNDRVLKLQRWLSKQDDVSAKDFLEIDAEAGVPEGSAKRLLDQWVSKPWRIAGPGSTCVTLERHEAVVQVVPRKGFFDDSDF